MSELMLSTLGEQYAIDTLEGLPWHALGQSVVGASSISEALSMARLDYLVEKRPIFYPIYGEDGSIIEQPRIPNRYATVNTRNNGVLGIVKDRYIVRQNGESFAALEPLVEAGMMVLDLAGPLGENGERVWILARIGSPYDVVINDTVLTYLLLVNSHKENQALKMMAVPIRVVRANMGRVPAEIRRSAHALNIRHIGSIEAQTAKANTVVRLVLENHKKFYNIAGLLAKSGINRNTVYTLLDVVFPSLGASEIGEKPRAEHDAAKIVELLDSEPIAKARGTAWSLYNAVTAYVDHYRSTRGRSTNNRLHNRLNSIWFGDGSRIKDAAMDYLLKNMK